jgi:5-methylcytosine-specific restriction endonuclease McrA
LSVFVLDKRKKPLMPCSEKRARLLLERGRARIHKLVPFTIRLVDRAVADSVVQPVAVKLDPGASTTGVALARVEDGNDEPTHHVLHLAEIEHRGKAIKQAMQQRSAFRRRRRGANLRYRPARFDNRTKPNGWLAPSLRHRVETVAAWVARYRRLAPVSAIAMELVRFDSHALSAPKVAEQGGAAYQQGDLAGYEVREYLLEKWGRHCAYCDAENTPLQIEHVVPRARGGSDRVSNLTLACEPCNQKKGALAVEDFLARDPKRLARIKAGLKKPLDGAAAMNATRWALWRALSATGLPVACATGGRTKWNRSRFDIPKTHALDAACVGTVGRVADWQRPTLTVKCTGRGAYQRTRLDRFGFPRGTLMLGKTVHGFQTGDLVRAVLPKGVHAGTWRGRVAARATGSFNIQTSDGVRQGISWRYCAILQRGDGYGYAARSPR